MSGERTTECGRSELTGFLDQLPDAVVAFDGEWRFDYVNVAAEQLLDETAERLLGRCLWHEFPACVGRDLYRALMRCQREQAAADLEEFFQERDRWYGGRAYPHGRGVAVIFRDVTVTKRETMRQRDIGRYLTRRVSERTLQLDVAEGRFKAMVDNLPAMLFLTDVRGRFLMANPRMQELFADQPVLEGRSVDNLYPSEIAELHARIDRQVIENRVSVPFEHNLDLPSGTRTLAGVKIPICGADGVVQALCGFAQDVTEQRQAEMLVRRADRLSSLGAVAAGVAHEINNPLSGAWNALQAALNVKNRPEKTELFERSLEIVATSIRRSRDLVANMLRFGATEVPERMLLDINEAVRHSLVLTESLARQRGARISFAESPALDPVRANVVQIEQAVVNLLQNAVQAGDPAREILIEVRTEQRNAEVILRVSDNCGGMDEATRRHAFDLFFTSGKPGGIGLGLAIVHRIVTSHGGTIELHSEPGRGTEAVVRLPVAAESQAPSA